MRSCEEISRLVSLSQEQTLSFGQRMELKMHIWMCRHCKQFHHNIGHLRNIMKTHAKQDPPKD